MLSSERLQLSSRSQCRSSPELKFWGLGAITGEVNKIFSRMRSRHWQPDKRLGCHSILARCNHYHRIFYFCCSLPSHEIFPSCESQRTFLNFPQLASLAGWPHATRPPSCKFNYLSAKGFKQRQFATILLSILKFGFFDTFCFSALLHTSLRV